MKKVNITTGIESDVLYVNDDYQHGSGSWYVVSEEYLPFTIDDVIMWAAGNGEVKQIPTKWGYVKKLVLPCGTSIPMGHYNHRGNDPIKSYESNDGWRPAINKHGSKDFLVPIIRAIESNIGKVVEAYLKTTL